MKQQTIGIDLGGTSIRVAAVTADGKILENLRIPTPVREGPEQTAQQMAQLVHALKDRHGVFAGIGIGSPGPLSRTKKMIIKTPNLPGFDQFPLGKRVEELAGLPVRFDNDAKAACYGEGCFGATQGKKNYILLTLGTGVGGGVMVDGRMLYGKSDNACELGHMTIHPGGRQCNCGNQGCLEQYASASALMRRAQELWSEPVDGKEFFARLESQNPVIKKQAQNLLHEFVQDLSIGVASLVNIFDPEMIVLGGGLMSGGGEPLLQAIRQDIKSRCFQSSQQGLTICASTLGGDAGVLGAASLVL